MKSAIEYALKKLIKELEDIPEPTEDDQMLLEMAKREKIVFKLLPTSISIFTIGNKIDELENYFSNGQIVYLTNEDIAMYNKYKRILPSIKEMIND